jgi:hypothetical protein
VELIGTIDLPGWARGLCVFEDLAYVGNWRGGMRIVGIDDPVQPREVASIEAPGSAWGVAISHGEALVVGVGYERFLAIDIENPERPSIPRIIEVPGLSTIWSIVRSGDLAFVGTSSGLSLLDFTDSQAPQLLGSIPIPGPIPGRINGIAVSGQIAYVAAGEEGLLTLDVANPEDPRIVGSIPITSTSAYAQDLAVTGGVAYVATGLGLEFVNVEDPANPRFIKYLPSPGVLPEVSTVTVSGEFAYVGDRDAFRIINVARPEVARFVAAVGFPGLINHIVVDRGRAYVAHGHGLSVIDIEDPARPRIIGSLESSCSGMAVAVGGGFAYVAARDCGLQVIDISSCQSGASLFRRGETNADDTTDITDAIFTLGYLFLGGPAPSCLDAADANDDGAVDITDAVFVLQYLFVGGPMIPQPHPQCGTDPTVDDLDCSSYEPCEEP